MSGHKLLGLGLGGWALNLALAVLLAFVLVLFAFQPVQVQGYSMLPHLQNKELLLIDKVSLGIQPLQRGDVVVFHYPLDPKQSFIKRIIGMPGDRVVIWDGVVYINGRALQEPYVKPQYQDYANFPEVTVPPHQYYVLGDHRNSSNDSRFWGCLPARDIFGRAVFAYWPPTDLGLVH